jgi:uncharacterized repeat protein (TIGR01451 family)
MRTLTLLVLAALFIFAGARETQANNWNRNQKFYCGHSPQTIAGIARSYDTGTSCGNSICPGQPVHIVHGIESHANDTNQVNIKINVPTTFTITSVQRVDFPNGTPSGTAGPLPPQTPGGLASGFLVGQLNCPSVGHADKVIVVIDGYFTQAGTYSASFDATDGPASDPPFTLSFDTTCPAKPTNISIKKEVEALPSGSYGPSVSVPYGTTVRFRITVTNTATTDIYLGGISSVTDRLHADNTNDVPLDVTTNPSGSTYQCVSSTGAASITCPSGSTNNPSNPALYAGGDLWVPNSTGFTYPSGSPYGLLPAGGSVTITFDVLIKTAANCSPTGINSLTNFASFNYMGSALSTSSATVNVTGLKPPPTGTPCPTATPVPTITPTKTITNPTTGVPPYSWGTTLTYQIQFTNTYTTSLTGIVLSDKLYGNGTPAFTATFSPSGTNPICAPVACTSVTPTTTSTIGVGTTYPATLFSATIGTLSVPLNAGQTETVTYQVRYDAPCGDVTTGGTIENFAVLGGTVTGTSALVPAKMKDVTLCVLEVDKTDTSGLTAPTWFSQYPQNLSYHVVFKNNSGVAITVGTVVDSIIEDSSGYGNVPINYSYQCTAPSVTIPTTASPLTQPTTATVASYNTPSNATYGHRLINFSGSTFQSGGYIDCNLQVTLNQPSTTDSLCEGNGKMHDVINAAYMNLLPQNYSKPPTMSPPWYADVTTPLPDCISLLVLKTASATAYPGGPVTFTVTVKNTGNDPISGVVLNDSVVGGFNSALWNWSCTSGCTGSGTGNLSVTIAPPLAPGNTATITITATAPDALGAYCNNAKAAYGPFPTPTYLESGQAALAAPACVQVIPGDVTPTPTATATATATPTPTPIPGCAQVTGDAHCLPNGDYSYTLTVKNNSGKPMSQILLTPAQGSAFTLTPQLTSLSTSLQSGQSTTVTTNIGNVKPGDKVCFFVSLMSEKAQCCIVQVCPTLPQCGEMTPTPTPPPPPTRRLRPGKKRP